MPHLSDSEWRLILVAKNYGEFRERLLRSDCDRCGLYRCRTQIVPDRGNPEAQVLFIGEAPGANEDLQGKAFVGRAGKLLDGMLKDLGFDTDRDALIINVAKCRPPDNRPPTPKEAATCLPYLKKQIELVQPKIIALLGATALKHITPEKKFSMAEHVGKFFQHPLYPRAKFFALYHPAYILRDPRKKPVMGKHLKLLVQAWKGSGNAGVS